MRVSRLSTQQIAVCARDSQRDPSPRRKRTLDGALGAAGPDVRAKGYAESGLAPPAPRSLRTLGPAGGRPPRGSEGAAGTTPSGDRVGASPRERRRLEALGQRKAHGSHTVPARIPLSETKGNKDRGQEVSGGAWEEVGEVGHGGASRGSRRTARAPQRRHRRRSRPVRASMSSRKSRGARAGVCS